MLHPRIIKLSPSGCGAGKAADLLKRERESLEECGGVLTSPDKSSDQPNAEGTHTHIEYRIHSFKSFILAFMSRLFFDPSSF